MHRKLEGTDVESGRPAHCRLKGIGWDHTRGFVPMVATAQRFEEMNPGVQVAWDKRSLQSFADYPMEKLVQEFDLIVMDHPHTAIAAESGWLVALDEWIDGRFLEDQASHSVGRSHESYQEEGHQWALATDAAAPIATWRPDLFEKHGLELPATWDQVLELARRGFVSVAAFPIDVLMQVLALCQALEPGTLFRGPAVASSQVLEAALVEMRTLVALCPGDCLGMNPIRIAEMMSTAEDEPTAAYCPLAYGYSNYSRPLYARHCLQAGPPVSFRAAPFRSVLGGAGIAVSSRSKHREAAVAYAKFVASEDVQKGIYFQSGGQPGYRRAWVDRDVNAACNGFFEATLPALDAAIVRPKQPRYMDFQDAASPLAHAAVTGSMAPQEAAARMNSLWGELCE